MRGISKSELDTALAVIEGLPCDIVEALMQLGFTETEISTIVLTPNSPPAAERLTLSSEESDRAVRLLRIYARAEEAIGNCQDAIHWLRKPQDELRGETPLLLVKTDAGARAVEARLASMNEMFLGLI
jgi:putative toxin-antitoxin system antitoxin component (TIGR02293 family)